MTTLNTSAMPKNYGQQPWDVDMNNTLGMLSSISALKVISTTMPPDLSTGYGANGDAQINLATGEFYCKNHYIVGVPTEWKSYAPRAGLVAVENSGATLKVYANTGAAWEVVANPAAFTTEFNTNYLARIGTQAAAVAGVETESVITPYLLRYVLSSAQNYVINLEGSGQDGRLIRTVSTGGSRPAIAADTRPNNTSLNTVNFTKLTGNISDPTSPAVACNSSILHVQGDGYPVPSANVHAATAGGLEIHPVTGVDRIAARGHLGHISFPGNFVAGVYGSSIAAMGAYSGFTQYAGYFNGNVFTTGLYLPSDETVKRNVKEVGKSGKLDVISYDLTIEVDDIKYVPQTNEKGEVFHVASKKSGKKSQLEEKNKIGYKAEQVALVYPDVIKRFDNNKIAVDYVQVLVHQILELNERIEKLENTK